jgi:hypothetical protein
MNTQTSNKRIAMLAGLLAALAMSGCGSHVTSRGSSSSDLASRSVVSAENASCNGFSSSQTKLTGKMAVYYEANKAVTDKIRVRITGINATFDTNNKYVIKMFKWKAYDSNQTSLDSNPLTFTLRDNWGTLSSPMDQINITTANQIAVNKSISAVNASDFFNKTEFVVENVDLTWDVLKVVLYDYTNDPNNGVVIGQVDALMPAFAADPTVYAKDHPAVLQALHPFYGETLSNYLAASQAYCF